MTVAKLSTDERRDLDRLRLLEVAVGLELSTPIERYAFAIDAGTPAQKEIARSEVLAAILRFHKRVRRC